MTGDRLAGRVALISGAGSDGEFLGTGATTAVLFGAQGALVGVLDLDRARAVHTAALVEKAGGRAHVLVADVSEEEQVTTAVDELAAAGGRIDIVVTNTGITTGGWARVLAVNLTGTMLVAAAAHPHLVAAGGGSIVTVSSVAALRGFGSGAYGASKGGVLSLTTDLAHQWGPDGIRVNCIVPGHLFTPIGAGGGEQGRELRRRANLLQIEGTAADFAWAALFLAGPESRFVTGVTLPVDGGTIMSTGLGMHGRLSDGSRT